MKKATLWMVLVLVLVSSPAMGQNSGWSTDMNCDGDTNVIDVVMLITQALGDPLTELLDENGDGVPDACEGMSTGMVCGGGTEPNETGDICVVSAAFLEQVFADGVESVDITSDNQAVADEAYASGFTSGAASVDCGEPLCQGMESVNDQFETAEGESMSVSGGCNAGCFGYASSDGTAWGYLCDGEGTACPSIYDSCSGNCTDGIVCEGEENCSDGDSISTNFTTPEGSSVSVGTSCNFGCFGYGSSAGTSWAYVCNGEVSACPSIDDSCSGNCTDGIVCEDTGGGGPDVCEGMESVNDQFETAEGESMSVSGGCNAGCFGYASSDGTAWGYLCDGEGTACPSIYDSCSGNCTDGIVCEDTGGGGPDVCEGMESVNDQFETAEGESMSVSGGCNAGCFAYASSDGTAWGYLCDGEGTACPSIYDSCSGSCADGIVCETEANCSDEDPVNTDFTTPEGQSVGVATWCNFGCFGYSSSGGLSYAYSCNGIVEACPSVNDQCSGSCATGIECN